MIERPFTCLGTFTSLHSHITILLLRDFATAHLSKAEWDEFCTKINKDLKHLSAIRSIIMRFVFLYIVIMVALYLLVEVFDMFEDIFKYNIVVEFLISLGTLAAVLLLYVIKARCSAKFAVRKHCYELTKNVCPRLTLQCRLPFCQLTGGMAKGWYISVKVKNESV